MRNVDSNTLDAMGGSRAGDYLQVYVWRGGSLAYPLPLPISAYSFDWDITRQIQKFTCEITDLDGVLAPWLLEDPLGVGGSVLQVRYAVGNAGIVNMGWFRIAQSKPAEKWRTYVIQQNGVVNIDTRLPLNKTLAYVSGGAKITITAYDITLNAKNSRLIAPESPPAGATCISEIKRLMRDICPVVTVAGVVDHAVSSNLIYDKERLDAVQDLCKRILCDFRMNGDGQLEIYPITNQTPVITLQGGPGGLLVDVDREQNVDGLYNIFVVDGTRANPDGSSSPIRGVQTVTFGPLAVDGPHGRYPEFYSSNMITTQDEANDYALKMMQTQLSGMTVDLVVSALPQMHLQQGEWVTVANPVVGNGKTMPLNGKIKTMSLSGKGAPDSMKLTVQCNYWDVQTAIAGATRVTI